MLRWVQYVVIQLKLMTITNTTEITIFNHNFIKITTENSKMVTLYMQYLDTT